MAEPADFCKVFIRQNDAVERVADQEAFDALPASLREVVNNSPIQVACVHLLQGCRRFGAAAMEAELRRLLLEWVQPRKQ